MEHPSPHEEIPSLTELEHMTEDVGFTVLPLVSAGSTAGTATSPGTGSASRHRFLLRRIANSQFPFSSLAD